MKIVIESDEGLWGVVNVHLYKSFVNEDWEYDEIVEHIISEMQNHSILFWRTDYADKWVLKSKEVKTIKKNSDSLRNR